MPDREKVIKTIQNRINEARNKQLKIVTLFISTLSDILTLLKEQGRLLRKKQDDVNKLCCEISELKHLIHDKPLKDQEAETIECHMCGHRLQKDWNWCPWCRWETALREGR